MKIQDMMKQAKVVQQRMEDLQAKLMTTEVESESGGGLVKITMTCRGDVRKLSIDPKIIKADDKEVLEDLVAAAVNSARELGDAKMSEETQKLMKELGLPADGKLPF